MDHSEPYYLFALPSELLDTLVPRNIEASIDSIPEKTLEEQADYPNEKSGINCNTCPNANHASLEEQRAHFRSDWHRYNIKLKMVQKSPVSSTEFDLLIDDLEGSISGSDSSSDDDDLDPASNALAKLISKTALKDDLNEPRALTIPRSPITWFHSPPSTQLGIYTSIFPTGNERGSYINHLKFLQMPCPNGRLWIVLMVAAGHFAGAVVQIAKLKDRAEVPPSGRMGKKGSNTSQYSSSPPFKVLKHKTFHRYTTRRKQGGGQSANDNAKGAAHSAGATLRRYGEQALQEDIRSLLADWSEEISDCERIWMRASGRTRRIFWDYNGALISKDDDRLRGFPFPTRRPTQSEALRCINELVRVKVTHFTESELKEQDNVFLASLPKPKPAPAPAEVTEKPQHSIEVTKLDPEQEKLADRWERALEMIRKNRLVSLQQFLQKEGQLLGGVDAFMPKRTGERQMTMLQIAASSGQEEIVRWLIEEARADPTIKVPATGDVIGSAEKSSAVEIEGSSSPDQTAYDVASTKEVRNVFRRCACAHPDWWDWSGRGHIPATLTKEMEEKRDEKKRQRRSALRNKIRERITQEKANTIEVPVAVRFEEPTSGPQKLGGRTGAHDMDGLTPEMRMRIERERRARAAEARLKAFGGH